MTGIKRVALYLAVVGALQVAAGAQAQWGWTTPASPAPQAPPSSSSTPPPQGASRGENFSAKPAAQLFSSDCTGAGCHKGPQGLAKDRGAGSLASFLREHYTNSRESAAALAAYLVGVPGGPARADPKQQPPRAAARTDEKPAERKPPSAVVPPAAIPSAAAPSGETPEIAKPEPPAKPAPAAAKPPRGRQAVAPVAQTTAPAAAPPEPAAPAAPPEPPKPQFDIFD